MNTDSVTAFIGLGSNLGDRAGNLLLGIRGLMEAGFKIERLSAIYETEPLNVEDSPDFLNMAAELTVSGISPTQMLARMLRIEYLLGRTDKSLYKPRTLDLDLLFYDGQTIDTPFLTIPHPRIHLRRFVLVPLNEIAPCYMHPTLRRDIGTLLAECADDSRIERWYPISRDPFAGASNG